MKMVRQTLLLIVSATLVIMLNGCASPVNRAAMVPSGFAVSKHFPYSVSVRIAGDSIADTNLQAAIEDAISNSRLFTAIIEGSGGDYELNVNVIRLDAPMFVSPTFTVQMETAWSLIKAVDRSVVFRKGVQSSGTATMGDAFVGVTRARLAIEAAARDNISQALTAIGELDL